MEMYRFEVFDRTNTTFICVLDVENGTVTEELNGQYTLDLNVVLNDEWFDIKVRDVVRMVNIETGTVRTFRIKRKKESDEIIGRGELYCEHISFDLLDVFAMKDGRLEFAYTSEGDTTYRAGESIDPATLLYVVLGDSGYQVGTVTVSGKKEISIERKKVLAAIQQIAETWDCDYRINEDGTVDLLAERGSDKGIIVRYGIGEEGISLETEAEGFANILFPVGASSGWIDAGGLVRSSLVADAHTREDLRIPSADVGKYKPGDIIEVWYDVQSGVVDDATEDTITDNEASFEPNSLVGGMVLIEETNEVRVIAANTATTITVLGKWNQTPSAGYSYYVTANGKKNIVSTEIIGFAYDELEVGSYDPATKTITISDSTPPKYPSMWANVNDYTDGVCQVIEGKGLSAYIESTSGGPPYYLVLKEDIRTEAGAKIRITSKPWMSPWIRVAKLLRAPVVDASTSAMIRLTAVEEGYLTTGKSPRRSDLATGWVTDEENNRTEITLDGDASKFQNSRHVLVYTSKLTDGFSVETLRFVGKVLSVDVANKKIVVEGILPDGFDVYSRVEEISICDHDSIDEYGEVADEFRADDVSSPNQLIELAEAELAKRKVMPESFTVDIGWTCTPEDIEVGDTITVVDDRLGINRKLRVTKKRWNPLDYREFDVEVTTENKIKQLADVLVEERKKRDKVEISNAREKRKVTAPVCIHWDSRQKICKRVNPPNTFCMSAKSNRDGRFTADGRPITKGDCGGFTPAEADRVVEKHDAGTWTTDQVNDDDWHEVAFDVGFHVETAEVFVEGVQLVTSDYWAEGSRYAEVRVRRDSNNEVEPADSDVGFVVEYRRVAGSTTEPIIIRFKWVASGYEV